MIVPSPRTWNVNDLETAALFNANIRDVGNFFLATPTAEAYASAAQNAVNNAWGAITLDGVVINNDTMWVSGTNFTCKTPGTYLVSGMVTFAANSTGRRLAGINLNTFSSQPNVLQVEVAQNTNGGSTSVPLAARRIHLNVNDTLQLDAYQNSGAPLALVVGGAPPSTYLSAQWVSNI